MVPRVKGGVGVGEVLVEIMLTTHRSLFMQQYYVEVILYCFFLFTSIKKLSTVHLISVGFDSCKLRLISVFD